MTIKANLHNIDTMKAGRAKRAEGDWHPATAWLDIRDAKGNEVTVFMDYDMACEIADLWAAMNREPEPPTYDEALAAKCDADARMDEARALKGMV